MTQQMTRQRTRPGGGTPVVGRRGLTPFSQVDELQSAMDELVQSAVSGLAGAPDAGIWVPAVDIEETEDAWIVEAEVPGVKREDVNVELRDSELVITGEIKERERKGILRRRTRRVGQFEFRVTLPGEADAENVEAKLNEGVLTLRIPKAERARPRRIEVGGG